MRPLQLEEGIKYLTDLVRGKGAEATISEADFAREAGVGIVVSDEEIAETLAKIFEENAAQIKELGHAFEFSKIIYKARDSLKWADQKKVMDLI